MAPRDLCRGLAAAAAQRRRVLPGTPDILAVFSTSPVSLSMPRALSFESWLYIRTPDRTERSNYSSAPPFRSDKKCVCRLVNMQVMPGKSR